MLQFLALMGRQRGIQVIVLVALYLIPAASLPVEVHQGLYAISLLIKELLLWLLPITVSLFIAYAVSSIERQAPLFILTLFIFEALSNTISVWYAFGCGHLASGFVKSVGVFHIAGHFEPLWRSPIPIPSWWSADKGTLIGMIFGIIAAFKFSRLGGLVTAGKHLAEKILTQFFARLIPLFILGFVARMYQTNILHQMVRHYGNFLLWLFVCLVGYIWLLFLIGNRFSIERTCKSIKNLLPAAGVAFISGCSLSSMPWTVEGTAKNLNAPDLAKAVIPATTNIQQIGDCIANTFLCFLMYLHFNGQPPTFYVWASFAFIFVLARFATAAVLGGAIFVMLPIYESYLGFTAEMIAIILAFNVILDPLITCANVVANGALCRIFERVWTVILERWAAVAGQIRKKSRST